MFFFSVVFVVSGDDFTFSRQGRWGKGQKVPFGTASDCYSAIDDCAQARFAIDLTDTSFRLGPNVRWQNIGKYANSRIEHISVSIKYLKNFEQKNLMECFCSRKER